LESGGNFQADRSEALLHLLRVHLALPLLPGSTGESYGQKKSSGSFRRSKRGFRVAISSGFLSHLVRKRTPLLENGTLVLVYFRGWPLTTQLLTVISREPTVLPGAGSSAGVVGRGGDAGSGRGAAVAPQCFTTLKPISQSIPRPPRLAVGALARRQHPGRAARNPDECAPGHLVVAAGDPCPSPQLSVLCRTPQAYPLLSSWRSRR